VGKTSFTGEILDDEFRERSINVLQVFERKNPTDLPMISSLNVRLIMFSATYFPLFHYSPTLEMHVAAKMVVGVKVKETLARFT